MFILTKYCLALLMLTSVVSAESLECTGSFSDDNILNRVESAYKGVDVVKADFIQRSYFAGLDSYSDSSGTVRFKKPGKMDWLYNAPDAQRFISDGSTLWYYQEEDNQVTLGNFDASFKSDLPVSFLLGVGNLSKSFSLAKSCKTDAGIKVELSPQSSDLGLESFSLVVRKEDYIPIGAVISDLGGSETTILFSKLQVNSKLDDTYFQFEIPKGVDVIDKRQIQ